MAEMLPEVGVGELVELPGLKVKLLDEVAVPLAVITVITPEEPLPTVAVILVPDVLILKSLALVLPNWTPEAPVKLVPVIVIIVPLPPEVGVKDVIVGNVDDVEVEATSYR